MFKKISLMVLAAAFIIVIFNSCEKGTEPEEIPPGRRDYTWEIDTITTPFFSLNDISGVAPNDVWAVGPGGGLDKTIWHYDGVSWTTDGISRGISPMTVFAIDDVVCIAGGDGKIWKRENNVWAESAKIEIDGFLEVGFQDIWGSSKNDIYAVGVAAKVGDTIFRYSVIAHYNGKGWKIIDTKGEKCSFISVRRSPSNLKVFFTGYRLEPHLIDTSKVYELNNNTIEQLYWDKEEDYEYVDLEITQSELIFVLGNKLCTYTNGKFSTFLNIGKHYGVSIRNRKDIFINMKDGIKHYNGLNFKYIYKFENNDIVGLGRTQLFKNEYFQIAWTNNEHNYIIHGILKE